MLEIGYQEIDILDDVVFHDNMMNVLVYHNIDVQEEVVVAYHDSDMLEVVVYQ